MILKGYGMIAVITQYIMKLLQHYIKLCGGEMCLCVGWITARDNDDDDDDDNAEVPFLLCYAYKYNQAAAVVITTYM